jgi:Integrase zinc binding domain
VDIRDLAAAQRGCQDCQRATTSPALTVLTAELDGVPGLVDISSGVFRPVVPASFHRRIFEAVHNLSHAGVRATRRLIASRYVWPGLATDLVPKLPALCGGEGHQPAEGGGAAN